MSLTPAGVQGEIKQQCERRSSAGGLLNGPRAQVRGVGVGVGRRTQALGPTKLRLPLPLSVQRGSAVQAGLALDIVQSAHNFACPFLCVCTC